LDHFAETAGCKIKIRRQRSRFGPNGQPPESSHLGVDRATGSIETARRRALALDVSNVRFEVAQLETFEPAQSFDALIGRFLPLYLTEPASVLRKLSRHVRAGGIVAFQEMDMSHLSQTPSSALFDQMKEWILAAFKATGTELDMEAYCSERRALGPTLHPKLPRHGAPPMASSAAYPAVPTN
jgi:ubiquinone/menaquinone biosynthesis C-methylase UbiE